MKAGEIREMSVAEAMEKLSVLRKGLAKERAVIASGTRPENPGKVSATRRDIARILTIINEKEKSKKEKQVKEVKE